MRHFALRASRFPTLLFAAIPLVAIATLSVAFAEPPEPPRGERPPFERGQFRPEGGGQRPRPSPERFVERAMRYDDDKDGKLDRDELTKFAEDLMERFGPGADQPPPPPRDRFDRGDSPEAAKRPDRPFDGERPERPRRPAGEDFPERPRRPLDDQPPPPPADPGAD